MLLPHALFVFLYVGSFSSFRSMGAGSQVFALLMLFICVIVHTMSSGKSLQSPSICSPVCRACLPSV